MKEHSIFVGMDVHKNSIDIAIAEKGREGQRRRFGTIEGSLAALDKVVRKPVSNGQRPCLVYEAGPCGYQIYRHPSAKGTARDLHLLQGGFDQLHFRRRGRSKCASKRNTLAVDHHHPLRTFAALGFADTEPPFFAGAKLPSAKVSCQFKYCRSSSSANSARQTSNQIPRSSHSFSRRQHVDGLGYRSGRSRQRAPLLSTQRIPSNDNRLSLHGLPPCLPGAVVGSKGSSFFHCSSFKNQVVRAIGSPPIAYYLKLLKKSSLPITC